MCNVTALIKQRVCVPARVASLFAGRRFAERFSPAPPDSRADHRNTCRPHRMGAFFVTWDHQSHAHVLA